MHRCCLRGRGCDRVPLLVTHLTAVAAGVRLRCWVGCLLVQPGTAELSLVTLWMLTENRPATCPRWRLFGPMLVSCFHISSRGSYSVLCRCEGFRSGSFSFRGDCSSGLRPLRTHSNTANLTEHMHRQSQLVLESGKPAKHITPSAVKTQRQKSRLPRQQPALPTTRTETIGCDGMQGIPNIGFGWQAECRLNPSMLLVVAIVVGCWL
jgi:hypothetical protein